MIAAIVVPFGPFNIFSTADCLDEEDAGDFGDVAFEAAPAVGFGRAGTLLVAERLTVGGDLGATFLDFDLLVAIWLSLISDSIMCCH